MIVAYKRWFDEHLELILVKSIDSKDFYRKPSQWDRFKFNWRKTIGSAKAKPPDLFRR